MRLFLVDAFTDSIFGGNPAGVAILENGEDFPSDDLMVKTAAELRYSETVFVKRRNRVEFDMRYFTPVEEVDLCGHATIAAFTALTAKPVMRLSKKKFYGCGCYHKYDEIGEMKFKAFTKAGELRIEVNNGTVYMDMGKAESLGEVESVDTLYSIMGEEAEPLTDMKPEIITTGLPDIMMPVKNIDALNHLSPNYDELSRLSKKLGVVGVHAFCFDQSHQGGSLQGDQRVPAIHARNFAPLFGIDEEAATGTANGALSYYLLKRGLVETEHENIVVQGEAMGRPSSIKTRITEDGDSLRIQVGGRGVIFSTGSLYL